MNTPANRLQSARRAFRLLRGVVSFLFAFCCYACATEPRAVHEQLSAPARESSAWLGRVRSAHRDADSAVDPAAKSGALEKLARLAAEPQAQLSTAEQIALRQDLYARAAQLALELNQTERAQELVQRGLQVPPNAGPFQRQLWIVAGRTHAARGDERAAAAAYHEAAAE